MTKIANIIEKIAINFAKEKTIAQEYAIFIIGLALLRLGTSFVSIYPGYYIAIDYADKLGRYSDFTAYIFLVIIEVMTVITLLISGKLIYTRDRWALPVLLVSGFLFAVSFMVVTNGMAKKESDNVNQITLIESGAKLEIEQINTEYQFQKNNIVKLIEIERANPQGWQNGQRISLTPLQLNNIKTYNEQLLNADIQRQQKIQAVNVNKDVKSEQNDTRMKSAAEKYWGYSVVLMALQLFVNIVLAFFYVAIHDERDPDAKRRRAEKKASKRKDSKLNKYFELELGKKLHDFDIAYLLKSDVSISESEPEKLKIEPEPELKKLTAETSVKVTSDLYKNQSIGFKKLTPETPINTSVTDVNSYVPRSVTKQPVTKHDHGFGYCAYCNAKFKRNAVNSKFCSDSHRVMFARKNKKD